MMRYKHWRTMSIPWRLATLLPTLCIVGATMIAVWYVPAIAAKVVAVAAGLVGLQATRDHYRAHDHRDIALMVGALAAIGTIMPLAVASLRWQAGLLLALLVAPLAGYGLRRLWSPSIVDEIVLRVGLPVVAMLPLLALHLYMAVFVSQMHLLHLISVLAVLMSSLGYWYAHMSVSSRQRDASPRPASARPARRLPAPSGDR